MDYEKLFPGRFIKSADFDGKDVTLTVSSVKAEQIDEKAKAIMSFVETRRQLVLNRTNAEAVRLCFGRRVEDWIGKRITFYPAVIKDPFGDGEISAIRVRGSPDIAKPQRDVVKRGRKTITVSVVPTGKKAPRAAEAPEAGKVAAKPAEAAKVSRIVDVPSGMTEEEAAEIAAREAAEAAAEADPFPS